MQFTLFDKKIEIAVEQERFIDIFQLMTFLRKDAEKYFEKYYKTGGNIKSVLDQYEVFVSGFIKESIISKLYDLLISYDIYDVSADKLFQVCHDTSVADEYYDAIAEKYNDILDKQNDATAYRAIRKQSRGRVVGGGFGLGGAMKGIMTAGAINATTGIGHSAVNAVGNMMSAISASRSKHQLYDSNSTYQVLEQGVNECVTEVFSQFIIFVNKYKSSEENQVWFDGSAFNSEKAMTLLDNSQKFKEKEKELLLKAFLYLPWSKEICSTIFLKYEKEREEISMVAERFGVDISDVYEKTIKSIYNTHAKNSSTTIYDTISDIKIFMGKYGVSESDTLNELEIQVLKHIVRNYKTAMPGENDSILEEFKNSEYELKNKKIVIKEKKVWELVKKYNVCLTDEEKEEIIATYFNHRFSDIGKNYEDIAKKAKTIMHELDLKNSNAYDEFEYNIVHHFAKNYADFPVAETDEILKNIVDCNVSSKIKEKYITDFKIWELYEQYAFEFSIDEKIQYLKKAYEEKENKNELSYDEFKNWFDRILNKLNFGDLGILHDVKQRIFDNISGISEVQNTYNTAVDEYQWKLRLELIKKIEKFVTKNYMTDGDLIYKPIQMKYTEYCECKLIKDEEIYLVFDEKRYMNPGKFGFCLTNKRFVVNPRTDTREKIEVPLEQINFFEKKPGFMCTKMLLHTRKKTYEFYGGTLRRERAELLNMIIAEIPDILQNVYSKKKELSSVMLSDLTNCIEKSSQIIQYFDMNDYVQKISALN